ncbi:hypothetical protein D3C72_2058700 [compost metagenome]
MSSLVLPDWVCAQAGMDSPRLMTASEPSANSPGALSSPRRRASGAVTMRSRESVGSVVTAVVRMRSMMFSSVGSTAPRPAARGRHRAPAT